MLKFISSLAVNLPHLVSEESQRLYHNLVVRLKDKAGQVSNRGGFERRKQEIRDAWSIRKSYNDIIDVMVKPSYIRPLIALWNSEDFFKDAPPCRVLFEHIERLAAESGRRRLSRLPLRELCLLFFKYYDNLEAYRELGQLLRRQLGKYEAGEFMFGMQNLISRRDMFFDNNGHIFLVKEAEWGNTQPSHVAEEYSIPGDSRFFQKAQQAYYLHRLDSLAPNQQDDLLMLVRQEEVARESFDERYRLGHKVITSLIDKLTQAGAEPEDYWMETILAIGGDPRVARTARSFTMWWQPLGEDYIQCMLRWLSKVDLELFLQICRDYVGKSRREDLARMYPDREKYLRWLFRQDLILQTHLFLGDNVRSYVRRSYAGKNFNYIKMSGEEDLAVFYLEIMAQNAPSGRLHIVEGTFSFKLKIMERIPKRSVLNTVLNYENFSNMYISDSLLRTELEAAYEREFNETDFSRSHIGAPWKWWLVRTLRRYGIAATYGDIFL